jgi:hypothetical protein
VWAATRAIPHLRLRRQRLLRQSKRHPDQRRTSEQLPACDRELRAGSVISSEHAHDPPSIGRRDPRQRTFIWSWRGCDWACARTATRLGAWRERRPGWRPPPTRAVRCIAGFMQGPCSSRLCSSTTALQAAYRATLASSPPRAPPLRSARYSATGVPRNLPYGPRKMVETQE